MERLISSMQDQIRFLKKDLKEAHNQISTHQAAATPTTALAATPAVTVAALTRLLSLNSLLWLPLNHLLPHPLATSTRTTQKKAHIFGHLAGSRIGDLLAAFYVEKRDTLCRTARFAQSSNACCANNRAIMLAAFPEDRSWNCLPQKMATKTPLMHI